MAQIEKILEFLNQEKVSEIKLYKNFQNSDCIVGTATSLRHINMLMKKIKQMNLLSKNMMEGYDTGWGILSFSDVECHIFTQENRYYYDLDTLWGDYGRIYYR